MKDRGLVGQTINCPDCGAPLRLRADVLSGIVGEKASSLDFTDDSDPVSKSRIEQGAAVKRTPRSSEWMSMVSSPVSIAWIVAAAISAALVAWVAIVPTQRSTRPTQTVTLGSVGPVVREDRLIVDRKLPEAELVEAESRLSALHDQLTMFRVETGEWPPGTAGDESLPEADRFSWLAVLAAQADQQGPHPQWDRPWRDPLNDRFVRQRQDIFLNPAVAKETGNDRYPATHFVGVTGVGPDAANLPQGHPRAGVFGRQRVATLESVTDGLANTMLIAGVEQDLGSWAAAGRATLRGFTAEPYVRGPDGFGTGQPDGMFVLMADGSTRYLSAKTDPIVIRRMAAIADGLPLDPAIVGEPGVTKPQAPVKAVPTKKATPEKTTPAFAEQDAPSAALDAAAIIVELVEPVNEPLDEPLADDVREIDVAGALRQPITRFKQSTPVPAREVLRTLEEMLAVKIDATGLPQSVRTQLDQPVQLSMQDTTVGEILSALLDQLGLSFAVRADRLELIERQDSPTD